MRIYRAKRIYFIVDRAIDLNLISNYKLYLFHLRYLSVCKTYMFYACSYKLVPVVTNTALVPIALKSFLACAGFGLSMYISSITD